MWRRLLNVRCIDEGHDRGIDEGHSAGHLGGKVKPYLHVDHLYAAKEWLHQCGKLIGFRALLVHNSKGDGKASRVDMHFHAKYYLLMSCVSHRWKCIGTDRAIVDNAGCKRDTAI